MTVTGSVLTINDIQESMNKVKEGFERANVLKSFLSYIDPDGRGVLEYENGTFIHFHTLDNRVFELADVDVYFILKNIKDGEFKLMNLIQVIKN